MVGHRCKNCMWWDNQHALRMTEAVAATGFPNPGICRKHRPAGHSLDRGSLVIVGVQPYMDADDFCGEFREDVKE